MDVAAAIDGVLQELSAATAFGGIYYPFDEGQPPAMGKGVCRFCSSCVSHPRAGGFCRNNACTCAVQGNAIGDVWYFRCWLGLDSLVLPIAPEGEIVGAIEVGGFFSPGGAEEAQQTVLSRLSSLSSLGTIDLFTGALQAMQELGFAQVKAIADWLREATFRVGLNNSSSFAIRQRIHRLEEQAAGRIATLDVRARPEAERYARLVRLTAAMRTHDRKALAQALQDFIGHVLATSGNDLDQVKAAVALLLAVLLGDEVTARRPWRQAARHHEEGMVELEKLGRIEEVCVWAERHVFDEFAQASLTPLPVAKESVSQRVLRWLQENYAGSVTTAQAARAVHASSSTVVLSLRRETGRSFTTHLTAIRVAEAKRLLAYTNLSLAEIGQRCGFCDQSYFTKVFRRAINLTPREFRRILDQPSEASPQPDQRARRLTEPTGSG